MTPEQQTPASVVERLTYILSLVDDGPALWTHGSPQSTSVSYGDLRAILAHVERLSAEREGLREALEPFAKAANQCPQNWPDEARPGVINLGHCRKAQAALTQGESRGGGE
jgi:hypothetical protein